MRTALPQFLTLLTLLAACAVGEDFCDDASAGEGQCLVGDNQACEVDDDCFSGRCLAVAVGDQVAKVCAPQPDTGD